LNLLNFNAAVWTFAYCVLCHMCSACPELSFERVQHHLHMTHYYGADQHAALVLRHVATATVA
jgi:hypothetical protein